MQDGGISLIKRCFGYAALSVLIEYNRSLHFSATWDSLFRSFLMNESVCGHVFVPDKFVQHVTLTIMLLITLR